MSEAHGGIQLEAPLTVNWALSNLCNLRCDHCYSRTELAKDLPTDTLLAIADKLADWGVCYVNFGGGEPLLHKDLYRITRHATVRGLSVSMNSNGWFVTPDVAERLRESGMRHVGISIDHPDEAEHDRLRGRGSWRRAVAAVGMLREAGVEVHLSSLVYRASLDEAERMVAMTRELGAARLNFLNLKPVGNAAENYAELNPPPEQWRRWYARAAALKGHRDGVEVALEDPISCSLDDGSAEPGLVQGSVCGKLTLSIKPDGALTACGFIPDGLGNAVTDDLALVWTEHAFLEEMRGRTGGEDCDGCAHQAGCRGGCTARTYALTGRLDARDPNCWVPPGREGDRHERRQLLHAR